MAVSLTWLSSWVNIKSHAVPLIRYEFRSISYWAERSLSRNNAPIRINHSTKPCNNVHYSAPCLSKCICKYIYARMHACRVAISGGQSLSRLPLVLRQALHSRFQSSRFSIHLASSLVLCTNAHSTNPHLLVWDVLVTDAHVGSQMQHQFAG